MTTRATTAARAPLALPEFIALMAMLFATIAFSIDSMLPALPGIGDELSPGAPNRAQLILTAFILGMGVSTFFIGPLSDAYGRKPVLLAGSALYIVGASLAYIAPSLELMLLARVIQGIGAAGPRVVGMAIIRDLYAGRHMARIMSLVMMVFTIVPALAPLGGAAVIALAGWRAIFGSFILFALITGLWLALRQPESLPPERRRALKLHAMKAALIEMLTHPTVKLSVLAQVFCYATLFVTISLVQPVFDVVFDRAETFPLWFGGLAVMAASASFLNAALVMRLGMRRLATVALAVQATLSTAMSLAWLMGLSGDALFYAFLIWLTTVFFQIGLTLGNLNAIAMEPMGHIAGMAASVIGALGTVGGAAIAIPIGLLFNGTPLPLTLGAGGCSAIALVVMLWMRRAEQRL
ncbi:MAG: multidrug effflux MFS transporter [Sediminimonas sp.]|uniref:multidrug effflux MFS transporter n=1 Tax=Sediminimonas sp. TaxID=2823379 RepID=UPI00286FDE9B|nr:multidrug effflux MFS transporter [Sediminimonas sp.]MDR9483729.1 multidrug effflux MFS transporter [Sediminimonas sp.]